VRLAREIAAQRGWRVSGIGSAIVLSATAANRARAAEFEATLKAALPQDGRDVRRWLANPLDPSSAALWFLSDIRVTSAIKRRRVRKTRMAASGSARTDRVSVALHTER
jgi:hypothetical protein